MKKAIACVLAAALLGLCGCSLFSNPDDEPFSAAFTIRTTAKPTEVFFDVPYSETRVSEADTKTYRSDALNFTALRNLFVTSIFSGAEDATAHLWKSQIRYSMQGNYTAWDTDAISGVSRDLVGVAGFPGMRATSENDANVFIRFTSDVQGSVSVDVDDSGVIRSGTVVIPQRLSNDQRQALIEQSLVRLCGLPNTVETTLDSVLSRNPASSITEVDLILLDILYGEIQPGMTRDMAQHAFDAHFQS